MIADASTEAPAQSAEPKPVTSEQPKSKKDVEREIKEKSEQISTLSSEARKITIAIGVKAHFGLHGSELDGRIEKALHDAALWHEVKDTMKQKSAFALSGGQQQRLCIARALAVEPSILLMDEPCSALDPISTAKIEELMRELAHSRTVVVVTHNLAQAERVSDHTAFFMLGEIVEAGHSQQVFKTPEKEATRNYVSGQFG